MKILILGAKGNLGGQLVKVFKTDDNAVIAWDKNDVDITDKELISRKIGELKPDIILNATAYNAVDKCEDDEDEYDLAKKINIDGPKYLAEAALKVSAVLVHYSTNYVFDGSKQEGYEEDDETCTINRYGKSKLHGEKKILELSGKGLKWYIIRTSKLFGPKGESEVSKPSFFDIMLKLSQEKDELDVVDEEASCFTYTPDLALYTKKLLESDKGYGIYHFSNTGCTTWYQAACELFKLAGKNDIKINPVSGDKFPRPAKRPKYAELLNTKFEALRDYREALKDYLGQL